MLNRRQLQQTDYELISSFAQSAEELFYIAPFADYPWHPDQFAAATSARLSNTVFLDDTQIIGFANFYDHSFGDKAFIGNLVVNPAMRRQGYGRYIAESMLDTGFSDHGFQEIHISCFSNNTPGLLLYRRLGFKPYGIEQRTDYNNEPAALVNFKITEAEYRQQASALDLDQVTPKLADI